MKEYIEKDLVMDALLHEQYGYCCEDAINDIPAADVVEVVRCRDCAYRHFSYCSAQIHPFPIHLDNYCSFGRKHLACSTSTGTTEGEVKQ